MITLIKYRFKCFLKNKSLVFWTLIFPMALATIFNVVLKDVHTLDPLENIKVAVVEGNNETLKELVTQLSDESSEHYLLDTTYASQKEAKKLLEANEVSAILYLNATPSMDALVYDYNQTILKAVINSYTRVYSQVEHMVQSNPSLLSSLVIDELFENDLKIIEKDSLGSNKDMNNLYFYTILSMVCLYGMMWGVRLCMDAQATQSKQAARVNVSPLPKLKMLAIDFVIGYTIMVCEVLLAMAYLNYILQIEFADNLLIILAVLLSGTFASLSLGTLFGSIIKGEMEAKVGMISAFTVFSNFLAGMMSTTIPYYVDMYMPILRYINPSDLIARSFSMLFYYQDYSPVYLNIAILCGMGMIFLIISYMRIRRTSYASI